MDNQNLVDWFKSLPTKQSTTIKLAFACELNEILKRRGITKKELADRLGTSQAWISKVLRGDSNFSIETMCNLAEAIQQKVHIHMEDENFNVKWERVPHNSNKNLPLLLEKQNMKEQFSTDNKHERFLLAA